MNSSKQTYRSGPFKEIFAQGVKVGDILYLAGQVGIDEKGIAGTDMVAQIELAYVNIKNVLSKFDATLDNIVDEMMFVTNMAELMSNAETIFASRAKAYGGVPDVAQTLVQVGALVLPELKLEIKCIAHL